jgi:hypothetical protein
MVSRGADHGKIEVWDRSWGAWYRVIREGLSYLPVPDAICDANAESLEPSTSGKGKSSCWSTMVLGSPPCTMRLRLRAGLVGWAMEVQRWPKLSATFC